MVYVHMVYIFTECDDNCRVNQRELGTDKQKDRDGQTDNDNSTELTDKRC